MIHHGAIGGKEFLHQKTTPNSKYKHVKAVVETGMTAELAQFIKQTGSATQRRPGEAYLRVRSKVVADYILHMRKMSGGVQVVDDGGFAHPMDEYSSPNTKPEREYLILDVRSEEEYKACHIEGAIHYPKRRMLHAISPFPPEVLAFKNKEKKVIVVYDLEEELTVGQNVATVIFEKGIDNVAILVGGLRDFVRDYASLIVGESPVPIVPRDTRLLKRAEAASTAWSETQRSSFTHKPKALSSSLAKPRRQ